MGEVRIQDFIKNPLLRQLVLNYCTINYEENARNDNWYLFQEYNLLRNEGDLNKLFEAEFFSNNVVEVSALT